jgi:hypothetical protein
MRQLKWVILLAVITLLPRAAQAQRTDDRTERRVGRLMDRLREEMWSYRQELDFFRRAPEHPKLVELRWRLRVLAVRVADLEDNGPRARRMQRDLAREMEEVADDLTKLTGKLEDRTDVAGAAEVRRRADRLKTRADKIREMIDDLSDVVR